MSSLHVKDAPVAYTGITSSAALPQVLSEIKGEAGRWPDSLLPSAVWDRPFYSQRSLQSAPVG